MTGENSTTSRRGSLPRRLLLLLTARTYRAPAFVAAAENLGIEVVKAISMHQHLAEYWHYPLGLQYDDPDACVQTIRAYSDQNPIGAIIAVDDSGAEIAARASQALGLAHNTPESALAARDKHVMRQMLHRGGVPAPRSELFHFAPADDDNQLEKIAARVSYPCVLKPLDLNGSRGVIRADDEAQFLAAAQRLGRFLLDQNPLEARPAFLVEQYIPGLEVAVEAMLLDGRLKILALFDKPDPLEGPYFEETIYVTPSRLPAPTQEAIARTTAGAAAALGLREGPVHAELRYNENGPWVIELAGRSIGGLCSKTLQFGAGTADAEMSLEEMIIRQAFGMDISRLEREEKARGVMMIPIPQAGLLKGIRGCEEAEAVQYIESVEITAQLNHRLIPLPEGDSYLGFIFARGPSPALVESALRAAHQLLSFEIVPELPVLNRDFSLTAG